MGSYWNADNGYSDKYAYPRIDLSQQLRHTYAIMPTSNFSLMVECNKKPQWRGHFYLHCHQRLLAEHCNCQLDSLSPTVTGFYDDDYTRLSYCTLEQRLRCREKVTKVAMEQYKAQMLPSCEHYMFEVRRGRKVHVSKLIFAGEAHPQRISDIQSGWHLANLHSANFAYSERARA